MVDNKSNPELEALRKENARLKAEAEKLAMHGDELTQLEKENQQLKAHLEADAKRRRRVTGKAVLLKPHFRKGHLLPAGTVVDLVDEVVGRGMRLLDEKAPAPESAPEKKPVGRASDKSVA